MLRLPPGNQRAHCLRAPAVRAMRAPRGKRASTVLPRNVTTVDAFLASRRIGRVSLVSIDTEGWDAFVMYGMANALRTRTSSRCSCFGSPQDHAKSTMEFTFSAALLVSEGPT